MPPESTPVHPAIRSCTVSEAHQTSVALVYRDAIKATMGDIGNYAEFESLAVKLTGRRSKASVVVCVYRPPGTVTSSLTDQLSDMIDQIMPLGNRFVVVGDFNAPGDVAFQLDHYAVDRQFLEKEGDVSFILDLRGDPTTQLSKKINA